MSVPALGPRQRACWLSAILLTTSFAAGCAISDHGLLDDHPITDAAALSAAIAVHRLPQAAGPLTIVGIAPARPAFTTDDHRHLLFELLLGNTSATTVELAGVDVLGCARRAPLASYRDAALAGVLTIVAGAGATPNSLAPGGVAVAFFDLPLARRGELPDRLATRFTLRREASVAPTLRSSVGMATAARWIH